MTKPAALISMLALLAILLALAPPAFPQEGGHPPKYAGSYKIASWRSLETSDLHHFFFLHPNGGFLLGAEWPGKETSRAVGTWAVQGGHLTLLGMVDVRTNQGNWRVDFARTYVLSVAEDGIRLKPLPQKNRFGLLGWPDAFVFFRNSPHPNLPSGDIPADERNIATMIETLREAWGKKK